MIIYISLFVIPCSYSFILAIMFHGSVVKKRMMDASFLSQVNALKQSTPLSQWQGVMKCPLEWLTRAHNGLSSAVCLAVAPVPCQPCHSPLLTCFLVGQLLLLFTLQNISKGFIHTTVQMNRNDLFPFFSYISHLVHEMYLWGLCH